MGKRETSASASASSSENEKGMEERSRKVVTREKSRDLKHSIVCFDCELLSLNLENETKLN